MHAHYRKKATECNTALGGLIFFFAFYDTSTKNFTDSSKYLTSPLDKYKLLHYNMLVS